MSDRQAVNAALTNPSFVYFIRNGVENWFIRRDKANEHIRQLKLRLRENYFQTEALHRQQKEAMPIAHTEKTDGHVELSRQLTENIDILEDEWIKTLEECGRISDDPNLVPTSGVTCRGELVMLDQLWFESKCLILALWVRQERRTDILLTEKRSLDVNENQIERLLTQIQEDPDQHGRLAECFRTQFQAIELIASDLLSIFVENAAPPINEAATKDNNSVLFGDEAIFRSQLMDPLAGDFFEMISGKEIRRNKLSLAESPTGETKLLGASDIVESSLKGKSFKLFQRLRKNQRFVSFDTLRVDVWDRKQVSDSGIKKAIERLNKALLDSQFSVEINENRAKLEGPIDPKQSDR